MNGIKAKYESDIIARILTNWQGVYIGCQYFYGGSTDLIVYYKEEIVSLFLSASYDVISQMIGHSARVK